MFLAGSSSLYNEYSVSLLPPARYFPVTPGVLRMRARLVEFGSDLGNGHRDALYFQVDQDRERMLAQKQRLMHLQGRFAVAHSGHVEEATHEAALAWMQERLASEHPELAVHASGDIAERYRALATTVQEEFVVVQRTGTMDRAIAVFVCFPGAWRPENVIGRSFFEIHGPVPGFVDTDAAARSMVSAMIDRGALCSLRVERRPRRRPRPPPGPRRKAHVGGRREHWLLPRRTTGHRAPCRAGTRRCS